MTTFYVRRRLAAVAPDRPVRSSDKLEEPVHTMCVDWVRWSKSRRYFGAPREPGSIMAALVRIPGRGSERPGWCSQELSAFHQAVVTMAPPQDVARRAFEAHFLREIRGVQSAAAELGISRATWYRAVNDYARRAYALQHRIMDALTQEMGLHRVRQKPYDSE